MRKFLLLYDYKSKLYKLPFYKKRAVEKLFCHSQFFHYSNITMFYVTNFLKKLPFASTNFQTSNKVKFKFEIKIPKMTKQHFQRLVFCKWLTYVSMICNYVHILEITKIRYLISFQFRYTQQTKKIFFQILVIIQRTPIFLPTVTRT